jgi:hypothetical protein
MKQMPDDGLYQAETSRLNSLHYEVVFDSTLNDIYWFENTTEKYKCSVRLHADGADREMRVEILWKEMRLIT